MGAQALSEEQQMAIPDLDACLYYARELRKARTEVQRHPENFGAVALVLESLGATMGAHPKRGFGGARGRLVKDFRLDEEAQAALERIRQTRNLAAHEGAIARMSGSAAIKIATTLEAELMKVPPSDKANTVKAWMKQDVVEAHGWWTVAKVRGTMIEGNFTALPIWVRFDLEETAPPRGGAYMLLRDTDIVRYLASGGKAKEHLRDVIPTEGIRRPGEKPPAPEVPLNICTDEATEVDMDMQIKKLIELGEWKTDGIAFVTVETPGMDPARRLAGVVTPHDLLPMNP